MAARTLDPPEPETANLGQPKKRSRTTTDEVEGSRKSAKKGKSKAADGGAPPLGKYLASNDKTTRDRAVAALGTFLSGGSRKASAGSSSSASLFTSSNISASNTLEWPANAISDADPRLADAELAKLYKGLFYCFWMSDKPLAQHSLAEALSTLCLAVRPPATLSRDLSDGENVILTTRSALQYWKGFWTALEVEWNGIDRHRMDKYLMWVRKYWNVGLRLLERVAWRREAVEEWTRIVRATVLRVEDPRNPISIAYHVSDLMLEELHRLLDSPVPLLPAASSEEASTPAAVPLLPLLAPFYQALAVAPAGTVLSARVLDNVVDPLLDSLSPLTSARSGFPLFRTSLATEYGSEVAAQPEALRKQVVKGLFDEGAKPETGDAQRRKLYATWRERGGGDDDDDA